MWRREGWLLGAKKKWVLTISSQDTYTYTCVYTYIVCYIHIYGPRSKHKHGTRAEYGYIPTPTFISKYQD